MKISSVTTSTVDLDESELFDVVAPSEYSGKTTTARIDRVEVTVSPGWLIWKLFGVKVKKDGLPSLTPFTFYPINIAEGRGVWEQIPAEIRDQLPYVQELTKRYDA